MNDASSEILAGISEVRGGLYNLTMSAIAIPKLTVDEYLAVDRLAERGSDYHDGAVIQREPGTWSHAVISARVGSRLCAALDGRRCGVANSSVRVRVSPSNFVYPDLVIVCGQPEFIDLERDTITNPKVIVEVLSPTTAGYDYGGKFGFYRRLPSFEEYLLVAHDEPRIDVFHKAPDGRWILTSYEGQDAIVRVESLDIAIPLAEIYVDATQETQA